MKTKLKSKLLCHCLLPFALCLPAFAQGTAFTYQGRLNDGGGLANGTYDLRFFLFDDSSGGSTVGPALTNSAVIVSNGLFTVTLDFGSGVFTGPARWLELGVRTNGNGTFSALNPRQTITPTAYAVFAGNVNAAGIAGQIADGQLPASIARLDGSGTFTGPVTFSNATGNFSGSAAGLTNLNITSGFGGGVVFELGTTAFFLSSSPVVGDGPYSVVAADVNGDGKVDLISANEYANTLTVLTNNGGGGFVLSSSPAVGNQPRSVVAADVSGDGKVDLISVNENANTLSVLINNGSGGFFLSSSPTVGNRPYSAVAADVNGDGKMDLISANYAANTLTVLINNGCGGFVTASSPAVGNGPQSVVAADVNGDRRVDLISANIDANTLTVLTNNGSGGFVLSSSPGVGINPDSLAATDVNGDGKIDLISANQDGSLSVLTNNSGGGFFLSSSPAVAGLPFSIAAADVNGDGRMDLISATYDSRALLVLTNNGSGGFALSSSPNVGTGPSSVAAADVNGDGKVDLISANYGGGPGNTLTVLFNSRQLNGVFAGNGTGLSAVNADVLDGFDGSAFARLAADQNFSGANTFNNQTYFNGASAFSATSYFYGPSTFAGASAFNGNVAVGNSASVSFGAQTRQMLNLWGTNYGIGVQADTLYFRCDANAGNVFAGFRWYRGGSHHDGNGNAGGGTELMSLGSTYLYVNGTFLSSSDRDKKKNFAPIQPREVLEKVVALPITRWSYKSDGATPHIGPVAQDFHAAFGLGTDNKHIATVDADGVALAAIQGLNQKLEAGGQKSEIRFQKLEAENAELKQRLTALEQLVMNPNPKGN